MRSVPHDLWWLSNGALQSWNHSLYLRADGKRMLLLLLNCSVVWLFETHGPQHTRSPCPSPSPRVCSNSCPLSQWCYPTISSSCCPLLLLPSIFVSIRLFSNESVLCISWPKYWSFSFSISPSNGYSGLISFKDWLVLSPCCPRDSQESSPAPQSKSINSLALSLLYGPTLTSIHDY